MALRHHACFLVVALGVTAACSSAPKGDRFTQADLAAIRQSTHDYVAAFNDHRTDRLVTHYQEDAVLMPPNSGTLRGKDWVKGYFDTVMASGAVSLAMDSKSVSGQGAIAYENGTYTMTTRVANGEETRDRGKYLFVLRRANGRWLYEYAMWNSDLPKPMVVANAN